MAQVHLHVCKHTQPRFAELVQQFEDEGDGLMLGSSLVLPVQRVPRYLLLLNNLCKYTPPGHPDALPLRNARRWLQKTLAALNADVSPTSSADAHVVMRLEKRVSGVDTLVAVGRRLLCEAKLRLRSIERADSANEVSGGRQFSLSMVVLGTARPKLVKNQFWFLFSVSLSPHAIVFCHICKIKNCFSLFKDIFCYCEHLDTSVQSALDNNGKQIAFQYLGHLPLSNVTLVARPTPGSKDDKMFAFFIHTQLEKFMFSCKDELERQFWLDRLDHAIKQASM